MINGILIEGLSGEMVSSDESGCDELIADVLAAIGTTTGMNTGYCTHEGMHKYMERILDKELDTTTAVLPPLYIGYGKPVNIGKRCFIQQCCTLFGRGGITIGNGTFIRLEVNLMTISYDPDPDNRGTTYGHPIVIGDKVWIGINSTVFPGVRIGCRAIVGAGSAVAKDVPMVAIVVDNPAQVIKKIETNE